MRALVVKLSSLGDLFNAMPAVQLVRRHTGAALEWVTQPEYVPLVRLVRGVERVIAYPRRDFYTSWPAFRRELRREKHELVLDFQGLLKSALVCRLAGGRRMIAPSFSREGSAFFLREQAAASADGARHAVDQCLDTVRHLGLPVDRVEWGMDFPAVDVPGAGPHIALAPFSRWPAKNWPLQRFRLLAADLLRETGGTLHLIGGPADRDACESLARELGPRVSNHAGATGLPQTGGLLARMDLLITNDSGPMHMACAAGTRVLALFGPTDACRTGPYGDRHVVLQSPVFTPDDVERSAYKSGATRWMDAIETSTVLRTALNMLNGPAQASAGSGPPSTP